MLPSGYLLLLLLLLNRHMHLLALLLMHLTIRILLLDLLCMGRDTFRSFFFVHFSAEKSQYYRALGNKKCIGEVLLLELFKHPKEVNQVSDNTGNMNCNIFKKINTFYLD